MARVRVGVCCVLAVCSPLAAAYTLTPLAGGLSSATIAAGEAFDLDVVLDSDGGDEHVSAIFRVVFSQGGLEYQSCLWKGAYSTGSIDDQSVPGSGGAALPRLLDEDSLAGPGYPDGVVDVELSNVTDAGTFGVGPLVTLSLLAPPGTLQQTITISVVPDTFDDGAAEVPASAGPDFALTVPEPATFLLLCAAAATILRRRTAAPV